MKQFGDAVILRDNARASVLRSVAQDPEPLYLVLARDGSERIVAESDLWGVDEYRQWIQRQFNWNGAERRQRERRRLGSLRFDAGSDRRRTDRRKEQLPVL